MLPTNPDTGICSVKPPETDMQPRNSGRVEAPGSPEADQVMTKQASLLKLTPNSPSQVLSKHLGTLHASKAKLNFELREADTHQAAQPHVNSNPFAALESDNPKGEGAKHHQEELREGWTFQGRKKHTPRIASPRQAPPQTPIIIPNHEATPGGRRKRLHSDVHCSYFSSLGISTPPSQEHARARIWLILSREKNAKKEILIYARNNAPPGLPFNIRITGSPKEEWTHTTALADITQSIESELEDKVLRYNLNLKDRLSFEWSWQEDQSRGGWECTILTHISTDSSAISVQNKRHLH